MLTESNNGWTLHCGTTGVACLRLGRRFVGCEMNEEYFSDTVGRLRAEENQTTIGATRAGQVPLFGADKC